jgi:hypothetical protein
MNKGIICVFIIIVGIISTLAGVIVYNDVSEYIQDVNIQDTEPFTFEYFEEHGKLAPELQSPIERFEDTNE